MILDLLIFSSILFGMQGARPLANVNSNAIYDNDAFCRYVHTFNINDALDDRTFTFYASYQPANIALFNIDTEVGSNNVLNFWVNDFSEPLNAYCDLSIYINNDALHGYHRVFNLAQNDYNSYENGYSLTFSSGDTLTIKADFSLMSGDEYSYYRTLFQSGSQQGYTQGYNTGFQQGQEQGYTIGYSDGYEEASTQNSTAVTIFAGICEVGLLPINVFLQFFNFEVFGINISALVLSIMTIAITIIIIRMVTGKKDD